MTGPSKPSGYLALLWFVVQPNSIAHAGDQWAMVATHSQLQFTATYDQSPFDGHFDSFDVALVFDPDQPAGADLLVRVKLSSVNTENDDRDTALAEGEWFDFKHHPWSEFRAKGFVQSGANQYVADGRLSLKGITRPVRVQFDWTELGDNRINLRGTARMAGNAIINRLHFDVGTGDWADDGLIGHRVEVRFNLFLEHSTD